MLRNTAEASDQVKAADRRCLLKVLKNVVTCIFEMNG